MTVLRRTWLDGPCAVLGGRPQRENLSSRGAFKGLKIPVSVVRFRPWAYFPQGYEIALALLNLQLRTNRCIRPAKIERLFLRVASDR